MASMCSSPPCRRDLAPPSLGRFSGSLCLLVAVLCGAAGAQEPPATFVDAPTVSDFLRELERRDLDRVAIAWCRERLTAGKPNPLERFDLTVGLARGAARGALSEIGADRETLWDDSRNWLETLRAEAPAGRRAEVDLVSAELLRLRGAWERRWASVRLFDEGAAGLARDRLAASHKLAAGVIAELEKSPSDGGVRVRDLMERAERLRAEVCLELWELSRDRPLTLPAGLEPAALSREAATALAYLAETARERGQDVALRETLTLLQARFARLRGDAARFEEIVKRATATLSPEGRCRLAVERLWLSGTADALLEGTHVRTPEWGWTRLRLDIDRLRGEWRDSPLSDRVARQQAAASLNRRMREFSSTTPGSWGLLGQQLEDSLDHLVKYGPDVGPIAERAKSEYLAGRYDAAVAAFLEAAGVAKTRHDPQCEFELEYRAASILVDRSRFPEAARRLASLVDSQPEHPEAASADLLACHALGMVAERTPSDEAASAVIERLTRHLERFPHSPKLAEAALRLGQAQLDRDEWAEALVAFQRVPGTHAAAKEALAGMTRAYRALTDLAGGDADNLTRLAEDVRTQWAERLPEDPRTWGVEACDGAVVAARLELARPSPNARTADDWLNRAEERLVKLAAETPETANRTEVLLAETRRLRVLSLAGRGELEAARQSLSRLADVEPESLLSLLDGLDRAAPNRPETAQALAQLQRETVLRLADRRATLSEAQRDRVDRVLARAYAVTGDRAAAIKIYRELVKARPREVELKIALAETLVDEGGAERLAEAGELWKGIEGTRTAGSVTWCEARLKRCELLARNGDKTAAEKLLKLTRLLHPKLGSPELARRYAEFEQNLGKQAVK